MSEAIKIELDKYVDFIASLAGGEPHTKSEEA